MDRAKKRHPAECADLLGFDEGQSVSTRYGEADLTEHLFRRLVIIHCSQVHSSVGWEGVVGVPSYTRETRHPASIATARGDTRP
jgi:hypothetical protein